MRTIEENCSCDNDNMANNPGKRSRGWHSCKRPRLISMAQRKSFLVLLLLVLQCSRIRQTSANASTPHQKSSISTDNTNCIPHTATTTTTTSVKTTCTNYRKEYNVYIVITPLENTIGRAAAKELSRQLEHSSKDPNGRESVICMVQCPPTNTNGRSRSSSSSSSREHNNIQSNESLLQRLARLCTIGWKSMVINKLLRSKNRNEEWLHRFSKASPILVLPANGGANFSFDPFGDTGSIRKSSKDCLDQIRMELLRYTAAQALASSNRTENEKDTHRKSDVHDDHLVSATIHIRSILFNPYGCPPPFALETIRSCDGKSIPSPLSAYKLISVAMFVDAALSARTTELTLPLGDEPLRFDGKVESTLGTTSEDDQLSLRIIVVGTEAARGLPKMGIPVPSLQGSTESSIRNKLLLDVNDETHEGWEEKYAEMNALVVLYLKALQYGMSKLGKLAPKADGNLYLGIVSPGMTPESFNIVHVPESARTVAFRWKLWLCRRQWVFDWLKQCEIAKSTEDAGALLTKALLNAPMNGKESIDRKQRDDLLWDTVFPSGSFVGAQSGTGGPLCEQSLLVYNATSNKVGLAGNAASSGEAWNLSSSNETSNATFQDSVNFLANRRLQDLVHRVVREIITD